MNENLKEKLNIFARSILYILLISVSFSIKDGYTALGIIIAAKTLLDIVIFDMLGALLCGTNCSFSDNAINTTLFLFMQFNLIFFSYFYAKICGLYKKLQKYNFWIKSLIFLSISCFAYLINTYDIRTLKPYETDFKIDIWIYVTSIFSAFLLNIFFNFLTKKFPKPFEKIGYVCSVKFFKNVLKRIKNFFIQTK